MGMAAAAAVVAAATNSRRIHSQEQQASIRITPPCHTYYHTYGGDLNNGHTSRMCASPGPDYNPHAMRTNMMNGLPAGLYKTILPSASGRMPHVPRPQCPPAPATWQPPPPPLNFNTTMPQMMPPTPYYQMHYMEQQFKPMPPQLAQPAPPAPAPPAGTIMMPYCAPYPQPHPF
jgi:hypothetical protein